MNRRQFVATLASAAAVRGQEISEWGTPVVDFHHHWRRPAEANVAHMDGAGIQKAVLLTDVSQDGEAAAMPKNRFSRFTSANVARTDVLDANIGRLRMSVVGGSLGFGEMKSQVEVDGPEMRRVYALAAEMNVPVHLHFQEVTQQTSVGTFNRGLKRFPALLKEFPKTIFIGHADNFWANASAEVPTDDAYPTGPIKPGGLTDRMLSDHENLWADLAAYSGRNFLARDTGFAADFLKRHQNKLLFGSDCFCQDGKGKGQTNPFPLMKDKCIARETLGALKQLATADVFRKITWDNAHRLLKLG